MATPAAFAVPKLSDTNYLSWAIKAEAFLRREGLWDITNEPPMALSPQEEALNDRARSTIILLMEDDQLFHIRNLPSAHECWDALREAHVRTTVTSQISLTRRLYRTRLLPGGSMMEHLNVMKRLFSELEEKQVTFTEIHKVFIILSSLDSTYDDLASSMDSLPQQTLTLGYLCNRLLDEEQRKADNKLMRSRPVSNPSTDPEPAPGVLAVKRCFRCNSEKHFVSSCPLRDPGRVASRGQRRRRGTGRGQIRMITATDDLEQCGWALDSGASHHVANVASVFQTLSSTTVSSVHLADGSSIAIKGQGSVYMKELGKCLHDVLFVPTLRHNLLSVAALAKDGFRLYFAGTQCAIYKGSLKCTTATLSNGLYVLDTLPVVQNVYENKPDHVKCVHLMHRRLGHCGFDSVKKTMAHACKASLDKCKTYLECGVCATVKSKACSVERHSDRITSKPLELIFADLIGPLPRSHGHARFVLLIVDHYTRYAFSYPLLSKDETYDRFKEWLNFAETKYGHKVVSVQTDRGTEFCNNRFSSWLKSRGIEHRLINVQMPQENGICERRGGFIQTIMRALLKDSGLSQKFWAEAFQTATYLSNRIFHTFLSMTPYEKMYGKRPCLDHLRVFGCKAFVHIPKGSRRKNRDRSVKLTFLGYVPGCKSWKFCDENLKITYSRSAKFLEHARWKHIDSTSVLLPSETPELSHSNLDNEVREFGHGGEMKTELQLTPCRTKSARNDSASQGSIADQAKQEANLSHEQTVPRRSQRETKGQPPTRFSPGTATLCSFSVEPTSYNDLVKFTPEAQEPWHRAMKVELESLREQAVYSEVPIPQAHKLLGSRWVYKRKLSQQQGPIYKARLVAQGFAQTKQDYFQTFAPTLNPVSLRVCLAVAVQRQYLTRHLDIKCAYLHANLVEDVYMTIPQGISCVGPAGQTCWKLHKALYGLKQSANAWRSCLDDRLLLLGFKRSRADPCVYIRGTNQSYDLLLVFVDDILVLSPNKQTMSTVIQQLNETFKVRDVGELQSYVGLTFQQTATKGYISHQQDKIEQLLETYKMTQCKGARTPMCIDFQKTVFEESPKCDKEMYQSAIGSLLYLSQWSRPDISAAVNVLSRHVASPKQAHWSAVLRILRYLKHTKGYCLSIEPDTTVNRIVYADADWAGDVDSRKSTSGIVLFYAGVLIGWRTARQASIALSSAESEMAALSEACNEVIYFEQLTKDLHVHDQQPTLVYEDNQACIAIAESSRFRARARHIAIKYAHVREAVETKLITLTYCPTEEMLADGMSKPLGDIKHSNLVEGLGLYDVSMWNL